MSYICRLQSLNDYNLITLMKKSNEKIQMVKNSSIK